MIDGSSFASLIAIGVGMGLLSGILGIGGGIVLVPALVLLLGFGQHTAEGTSLLAIVPTAMAGAMTNYRQGYVEMRTALALAVGGMVGAGVGSRLALVLTADRLRAVYACFLLFMAARFLLKASPGGKGRGAEVRR